MGNRDDQPEHNSVQEEVFNRKSIKALSEYPDIELQQELNRRKTGKRNEKKITELKAKLSKSLKMTERIRQELYNIGYYESENGNG